MSAPLIIAIDGPSGVGKSTVARLVAEALTLPLLDTGAMYRALGLKVLRSGIDPEDGARVDAVSRETELEVRRSGLATAPDLYLDGAKVGTEIRDSAVSDSTSKISTRPEVRRRMVELQREFARQSGCVVEGRDIGSVVFPKTPHKFFLTADSAIRAQRRLKDLQAGETDLARTRAELEARDLRDRNRRESPLICDDSYQVIDTSKLDPQAVTEAIVAAVTD